MTNRSTKPHPRLDALRALAHSRECSALLITDPVDAAYASGFCASSITLLITSRAAYLLTDFRYREAVRGHCRSNPAWTFIEVKESAMQAVAAHIRTGSTVGVQGDVVTLAQFAGMKKACPGVRFRRIDSQISALFQCKERAEVTAMSRAAAIGDRAFEQWIPTLHIGMTEIEAARRLEGLCAEGGSAKPSFDTIVLFGARSAMPHGVPSTRRLRRRDWVLCDFGCTVGGYCSDMTRTVFAGRAGRRAQQIYETVRFAQELGRSAVQPGIAASALDAVVRDHITARGFGDAFGHATGHGVGRRIHESPRVSRKDATILHSGMVVTIEPGIYLGGVGGVRIEDMMLVTAGGARTLTHSPRHLREVDL